jgi:hypothetical protein
MFDNTPELKLERVVTLFRDLNPSFQDYALKQIDQLLELQNRKDDRKDNRGDNSRRDDGPEHPPDR